MTALVVGATGATGRLLVQQLLDRGAHVKVIVRSLEKLPEAVRQHGGLSIVRASVLGLTDAELAEQVDGCDAVASCLGHVMNFKGMYGRPRRLVADATGGLCAAISSHHPERPVKFVLMNTVGNPNRDLQERRSAAEVLLVGIMRSLLPPQADNGQAAEYLRTRVGQNDAHIEWAAVRPDTLVEADAASAYDVYPSPVRSAIFNPGRTSRINVAHFMAALITDTETWDRWKGQMPAIYDHGYGADDPATHERAEADGS